MAVEMPMFPLGAVLFPGGVAPLRLFEPRYLTLYHDVIEAGKPFAIVLIERGLEVGGGDSRFSVGTKARPLASTELADGTYLVVVHGTARVRVLRWVAEVPYPRALVEEIEEQACPESGDVSLCRARLATMVALLTELGVDIDDAEVVLADDPVTALFQIAELAPLQALDKQRLLETDGAAERAQLLRRMLDEHNEFLRLQLGAH